MKTTASSTGTPPGQATDIFLLIFFGLFLCMGLLVFSIGLSERYERSEFKRRNPAATGVVSNYFDSMSILVTYKTAAGEEIYAMPKDIHWPRPTIGRRIRLWYNPAQPQEVVALGGKPPALLAGTLALLIFGGVGATGLYFSWRRLQRNRWLYRYGQRVEAAFLHAYWAGWVHGKFTYNVHANWTDPSTGETYTFTGFLYGKSLLQQLKEQRVVTVLLDPADPGRYWMELPE